MSHSYDYRALNTDWARLRRQIGREPTIEELWYSAEAVTEQKEFVAALRMTTRHGFLHWDPETDLLGSGLELKDEEYPDDGPDEPIVLGTPRAWTVLFVAASPEGTHCLQLEQEADDIRLALNRSPHGERITLVPCWKATPDDLLGGVLDLRPEIVHFSGHGLAAGPAATSGGIAHHRDVTGPGAVFESEDSGIAVVPPAALCALFSQCRPFLRCVVLNACHSEPQAAEIAQDIDYAIGMRDTITDRAARRFAVGFYRALGAGHSIPSAFAFGTISIALHRLDGQRTPVLKTRTGA